MKRKAMKTYFVTGTDTDAGKTFVSATLLHKAGQMGYKTLAHKPVAAGCEQTDEGLRNSDATTLMAAMNEELDYELVNPIALEPPIAPHIAAAEKGMSLSVSRLNGFARGMMMAKGDLLLIEGAGGWRVPLGPRETLADLAISLKQPVILVVGMKLGCISHALLTAEAIKRDGLELAGWVANKIDPDMNRYKENLATLHQMLPAPLLAEIPNIEGSSWEQAADHFPEGAVKYLLGEEQESEEQA